MVEGDGREAILMPPHNGHCFIFLRIPQLSRFVIAGRGQKAPTWTVDHSNNSVLVMISLRFCACLHIPQPGCAISAGAGQLGPLRVKGHINHPFQVAIKDGPHL